MRNICPERGCKRAIAHKGLCKRHYRRQLALGKPVCQEPECDKRVHSRGYCHTHYMSNIYRNGAAKAQIKPKRQPGQPGSRDKTKAGYIRVYLPEHPNARSEGTIFEHTLIMSELLGRPLYPDEQVHHKNGVRDDNRPENLVLKIKAHGPGITIEDAVQWAEEIIRRYPNQRAH